MSFEIGDKVMLVRDNWTLPPVGVPNYPRKGIVYVIREFTDPFQGLRLVGHFGGLYPVTGTEYGWAIHRFRKLSDIQQENREKRMKKVKVVVRRKIGETSDGHWILGDA